MVETVGRVFAAVVLPSDIRLALADRVSQLDIPGKLVPAENWHVTLRFLGVIDEVTLDRFLHGLAEVGDVPSFRIRLDRVGAFPKPSRATVVWIGVSEGDKTLGLLNEIAENAASASGLEPEDRPYHPHLTLSRVRPPVDVRGLVDTTVEAGWIAEEVTVFRSILGSGGARYEVLDTFELAR
ncbi:MAG: RNA 2',3'-cyclic phosphodiesterase [Acidimicrobiia bacterium]